MGSQRLRGWLARPGLPWAGLALALAILAPSLGAGLRMDDRWLRIFVLGDPQYPGFTAAPHRLFDFFRDTERIEVLRRMGFAPWFADPSSKITFFRPLTSLLHFAEFRLLGERYWVMHGVSLALYAALVAAAVALYRRLFSQREGGSEVVGLAAWVFAVDHAHGVTASWIAQRNSLLAAFFGVLAVLAHDRAQRDKDRRAAWFAPALTLLSLLSAEAGSATLAAVLAHTLTLTPRGQRLRSFAPHALVASLWAGAYLAGGYGVRASGMYLDALRYPAHALPRALLHHLVLLGTELGNPLTDVWPLAPDALRGAAVALSALLLAGFGLAAAPLVARDPVARFLALASALSLLPPAATLPQSRLLLFASVFQLGLLAQVALELLRGEGPRGPSRRVAVAVVGYATLGHALLSPLLLLTTSSQMIALERAFGGLTLGMPVHPERQGRTVIVNAPDLTFIGYAAMLGPPLGRQTPRDLLALASGTHPIDLTVVDDRTLRVKSHGGFSLNATDSLLRSPAAPLAVGTTFDTGAALVTVTHAAGNLADEAEFRFTTPLSDPSRSFRRWQGDTLVPFALPPPGQPLRIDPQPFLPLVLAASQGGGADVPGRLRLPPEVHRAPLRAATPGGRVSAVPLHALLASLLALLALTACDSWPGLEKTDGGVSNSGASQLDDTSGRFGSACSNNPCQSGLTCVASFPNGLCTRACQSNADCAGGVCVPMSAGLLCLPTCFNDQTCRPGYSCQSTGDATVCAPGGTSNNLDAGTD